MTARIHLIAGARPNFMKIAPLWRSLQQQTDKFDTAIVHTGQHYDDSMSEVFLRQFGLPNPHYRFESRAESHAGQTASIMLDYERLCLDDRPDWVVVVGDVNSTVAASLVAKKLNLHLAHLEAGLRSFDRTMPEEINRLVTDAISDLLWTPSPDGDENLLREGVAPERIVRVGNVMIDTFEMMREQIAAAELSSGPASGDEFGVVTLHRPANVDSPDRLKLLVAALFEISSEIQLLMPLHPRTRRRLEDTKLLARLEAAPRIHLTSPLGYIEFMAAVSRATLVVTDSGGVQEETTYLGIPCLTLRDNTERPITVTEGSNRLVTLESIKGDIHQVLSGPKRVSRRPELWDGQAAGRVLQSLATFDPGAVRANR